MILPPVMAMKVLDSPESSGMPMGCVYHALSQLVLRLCWQCYIFVYGVDHFAKLVQVMEAMRARGSIV